MGSVPGRKNTAVGLSIGLLRGTLRRSERCVIVQRKLEWMRAFGGVRDLGAISCGGPLWLPTGLRSILTAVSASLAGRR